MRVAAINDWASNTADFSLTPSLTKEANRRFPPLNAAQIYQSFYSSDALAGFCGSTAVFASKVLREFGIDAFTVNFGVPGGDLTHVTVVWRADDGRFHFADPTFNGTFEIEGLPVDVFSDLENAVFRSAPITDRHFLFRSGEADHVLDLFIPDPALNCSETEAGLLACRRADYTIDDYFSMFQDKLEAYELTSGSQAFAYLFKQGIFSVGEGLTPGTRAEFLAKAKAAGIPFLGRAKVTEILPPR